MYWLSRLLSFWKISTMELRPPTDWFVKGIWPILFFEIRNCVSWDTGYLTLQYEFCCKINETQRSLCFMNRCGGCIIYCNRSGVEWGMLIAKLDIIDDSSHCLTSIYKFVCRWLCKILWWFMLYVDILRFWLDNI